MSEVDSVLLQEDVVGGAEVSDDDDDNRTASSSDLSEENVEEERPQTPQAPLAKEEGRVVRVSKSQWPEKRKGTIFFPYPREARKERPLGDSYETRLKPSERLNYRCAWERNCVKAAFLLAGFKRVRDGTELAAIRRRPPPPVTSISPPPPGAGQDGYLVDGIVGALGVVLSTISGGNAAAAEKNITKRDEDMNQVQKIDATRLAWSASWTKHPSPEIYMAQNRYQKVNHFPASWCLGRKDRLMRTLNRAKKRFPEQYAFYPDGFMLPTEIATLESRARLDDPRGIWIVKPPASSCGRGIRLVQSREVAQGGYFPKERKLVAQKYVDKPFLEVNGRKFDLRVYALLTSLDPLVCYVFDEGLVRFSTHKYTMRNLRCRYVHLTNYSVNKKSKHYVEADTPEVTEEEAFKWSLEQLWSWLEIHKGNEVCTLVKTQMHELIIKTLIAGETEMTPQSQRCFSASSRRGPAHVQPCFELFGFDILLDADLKPWLIEVNVSPSLMGGSALDRRIKSRLMADVFHLVGFEPLDMDIVRKDKRRASKSRSSSVMTTRPRSVAETQSKWRESGLYQDVQISTLRASDWDMLMRLQDELKRSETTGFQRAWPPDIATTASPQNRLSAMLELFQNRRFSDALLAKACLTPLDKLYHHCPDGPPHGVQPWIPPPRPKKLSPPQRPPSSKGPLAPPKDTAKTAAQKEYIARRRTSTNAQAKFRLAPSQLFERRTPTTRENPPTAFIAPPTARSNSALPHLNSMGSTTSTQVVDTSATRKSSMMRATSLRLNWSSTPRSRRLSAPLNSIKTPSSTTRG